MAAVANIQRQPFCALNASSQFTRYESRMPVTMVIWFRATSLPAAARGRHLRNVKRRKHARRRPRPGPPRRRAAANCASVCGSAAPMAESAKSRPEIIRTRLRPKRSLSQPATLAPKMQPNSRLLAAISVCDFGQVQLLTQKDQRAVDNGDIEAEQQARSGGHNGGEKDI